MLAAALAALHAAQPLLVERTHAWFAKNAAQLMLDSTVSQLEELYVSLCRSSGANR